MTEVHSSLFLTSVFPEQFPQGRSAPAGSRVGLGLCIPPSNLPLIPILQLRVPVGQRWSGQVEVRTAGCSLPHLHPKSGSSFLLVASSFTAWGGQNNDFLGNLGKSTNSEMVRFFGVGDFIDCRVAIEIMMVFLSVVHLVKLILFFSPFRWIHVPITWTWFGWFVAWGYHS